MKTLTGMVNGLNRMDDTIPFSTTAFLLAIKMIDLFNGLRWSDEVAVDLNRMMLMAKCASRSTIIRARDELVHRGVLTIVSSGKKGVPSIYRLNDIAELRSISVPDPVHDAVPNDVLDTVPNDVPNDVLNPVLNSVLNPVPHPVPDADAVPHPVPHPVPNPVPNPVPHMTPISRLDKTRLEETVVVATSATAAAFTAEEDSQATDPLSVSDEELARYRESLAAIEDGARRIGLPVAPGDVAMIDRLMGEYGAAWVLRAIERTQDRSRTWGVVKGILRSWRQKGGIDDGTIGRSGGAVHGAGAAGEAVRSLPGTTRV